MNTIKRTALALIGAALCLPTLYADGLSDAQAAARAELTAYSALTPWGEQFTAGIDAVMAAQDADAVERAKSEAVAAARTYVLRHLTAIHAAVSPTDAQGDARYLTGAAYNATGAGRAFFLGSNPKSYDALIRFCYSKPGTFTLMSNTGWLVSLTDATDPGTLTGTTNEYNTQDYAIDFTMDFTGGELHLLTADRQHALVADADGAVKLVPAEQAISWTVGRALDEQYDRPVLSTEDEKHYYTLRNVATGGYLSEGGDALGSRCYAVTVNKYSFWMAEDRGSRNGAYYLVNVETGHYLRQNTDNDDVLCHNSSYKSWINDWYAPPFSAADKPGLILGRDYIQAHRRNTVDKDAYKTMGVTYTPTGYVSSDGPWVDKGNSATFYRWIYAPVEPGTAMFADAKTRALNELRRYVGATPFAKPLIQSRIEQINGVSLEAFATPDEAVSSINARLDAAHRDIIAAINAEANGADITVIAAARRDAEQPAFMTMTKRKSLNTTEKPTNNEIWNLVADGSGAFNLVHRASSTNIGAIGNAGDKVTVAGDGMPGRYVLAFNDGTVSLTAPDGKLALALPAGTAELTGAEAGAEGTELVLQAAVWRTDDMPVISEGDDIQYYTISSVLAPEEYVNGGTQAQSVVRTSLDKYSYWYILEGPEGGVYLKCQATGKYMNVNSGMAWCYDERNATPLYILPNGINDEGFVISTTPRLSEGGSLRRGGGTVSTAVGTGTLTADNWREYTWLFKPSEGINHEAIFRVGTEANIALLKSYRSASPWGHSILNPAITKLEGSEMTDYGNESESALNAQRNELGRVIAELTDAYIDEPDGCDVYLVPVAKGAGMTVRGTGVTTAADGDGLQWRLEYAGNGSYSFSTPDGRYIAPCGTGAQDAGAVVNVTDDKSARGRYLLTPAGGFIALQNLSESQWSLGVNDSGRLVTRDTREWYALWRLTVTPPSSVELTTADSNRPEEYYNMYGVRTAAPSAPGIYIVRRTDGHTEKVLVK